MSFAEGEPFSVDSGGHPAVEALVDSLSRLHAVTARRWGRPGRPRLGSIHRDWARSVTRRLTEAASLAPEAVRRSLTPIGGKMLAVLERLPRPREFQLCHHHLAPDDALYDRAGGRLTFVDCGGLQFSRAARDVADAITLVLADQPEAEATFLARYEASIGQDAAADVRRELPFFRAFGRLVKLRSRLRHGDAVEPALEALVEAAAQLT